MKLQDQRFGVLWKILGDLFCLFPALCSAGITVASILGVFKKPSDRHLVQLVFLVVYAVIVWSSLACIGEYIGIKWIRRSTLLHLFDDNTLTLIQKTYRILEHTTLVWLGLVVLVNMLLARIIWGGDGHGLAGTWLFDAGGTPIIISFLAVIPVRIQIAVWKLLLKRTGKWRDGPYE